MEKNQNITIIISKLKGLNFTSEDSLEKFSLFNNIDNIDKYYSKSIDDNSVDLNSNSNSHALSYASAFLNMLTKKLASAIFGRFPEYTSENKDILKYIDNNKEDLTKLFNKAIFSFIKYGSAALEIDNNKLTLLKDLDNTYMYEDMLIKKGTFNEEGLDVLAGVLSQEDLNTLRISNNVFIIYYNNKKYLRFSSEKIIELELAELSSNLVITDNNKIVDLIYIDLLALEKLYSNYLKTLDRLKTIALYDASAKKEVQEQLQDNFVGIPLHSASGLSEGISKQITWFDNMPIVNTLTAQKNEIENLKLQIIEKLDLRDLFNNLIDANPNETKEAAINRIAVSSINFEKLQQKFNDFIETSLKYLFNYLGYADISLELDSISILQKEQENAKKEQDLQKIMVLVTQLQNPSNTEALIDIYYYLIEDIIQKSNISNEFLTKIKTLKEDALKNYKASVEEYQASLQNPMPNLDLEKLAAEVEQIKLNNQLKVMHLQSLPAEKKLNIEEKQADIENKQADTQGKQIDNNMAPIDAEVAISDAEQQLLDAKTRASKKLNKNIITRMFSKH